MRYLYAIATIAAAVMLLPSAAHAGKKDDLVNCAWTKVPETSNLLSERATFDGRYLYSADGSPTGGLLMRVWAACSIEKSIFFQAYVKNYRRNIDAERAFLKLLKKRKPEVIPAETFITPVFRCEHYFLDSEQDDNASALSWSYGSKPNVNEISYSPTLFGTGSLKLDVKNDSVEERMSELIRALNSNRGKRVEVETVKEGKASGRPYVLKKGSGKKTCKMVTSTGEFVDA